MGSQPSKLNCHVSAGDRKGFEYDCEACKQFHTGWLPQCESVLSACGLS